MANREMATALRIGRSYGALIDNYVERYRKAPQIMPVADDSKLLRLLAMGRIDWIFYFPSKPNFTAAMSHHTSRSNHCQSAVTPICWKPQSVAPKHQSDNRPSPGSTRLSMPILICLGQISMPRGFPPRTANGSFRPARNTLIPNSSKRYCNQPNSISVALAGDRMRTHPILK